jgi:DNA-binding NarL/FixJ family response regulator
MLLDEHSDTGLGPIPGESGREIAARRGGISLVVVDAHAAMREGLPLLLAPEGVDVVASAATGDGGEAVIGQYQPDVALVALELADADGIVLLRRLVHRGVRSAIVLYTDDEDPQQAALAVHAGAAGVIAKNRSIGELAAAVRLVAGGGLWFNEPGDAGPEPQRSRGAAAVLAGLCDRRTATLSDAELRVLALVAGGSSTEAMAEELRLSPHTVRTHLRNVMRKLEASSRAHAVAIAIREEAIPA